MGSMKTFVGFIVAFMLGVGFAFVFIETGVPPEAVGPLNPQRAILKTSSTECPPTTDTTKAPTPPLIPLPEQEPKANKNNPRNQYDQFYYKQKYTTSKTNIAVIIMAVGKYLTLGKQCVDGFRKYFCAGKPNTHIQYLLFTDSKEQFPDDITVVPTTLRPWPESTIYRFDMIAKHVELLDLYEYDYIYYTDADQLPVDHFCEDILGERVAVGHPHYTGNYQVGFRHDGYETNPASQSCVTNQDLSQIDQFPYISAAFFGGSGKEFMQMMSVCRYTVDLDYKHGVVAKVHDESHVNKYFLLYSPTLMLNYSYMYPEPPTNQRFSHVLPYKPVMYAVNKDSNSLRT